MRKKTFSRFLQGAVSMVMVASMLTGLRRQCSIYQQQ